MAGTDAARVTLKMLRGRLSRRGFLKRLLSLSGTGGAALLSQSVNASSPAIRPSEIVRDLAAGPPGAILAGRAFGVTEMLARPDPSAESLDPIWPDGVVSVLDENAAEGWLRVADPASGAAGYIRREDVQPMVPYQRPVLFDDVGAGFWAEMIAPASAIRAWCGGPAPVVARLGFGAVAYVADRLTDDSGQTWYGLAAEPGWELIGWGPALHYARWTPLPPIERPDALRIEIYSAGYRLTVKAGGRSVGQSAISARRLTPGRTTLRLKQPGGALTSAKLTLGVPWQMRLGGDRPVYGVFWHNRFGTAGPADEAGGIELPVFAARWLYNALAGAAGNSDAAANVREIETIIE